jgi:hypothetical protein
MKVVHIGGHVDTKKTPNVVPLEQENQRSEKIRESSRTGYFYRPNPESATGGNGQGWCFLLFGHPEQELYHRPGRHEPMGGK